MQRCSWGGLQVVAGNKFQIFVTFELIDGDERVATNLGVVHHHSAAVLPDEPAVFGIVEVSGRKLDLRRMPMEPDAIAASNLFAGTISQYVRHVGTNQA
jgi:hypothetical protein